MNDIYNNSQSNRSGKKNKHKKKDSSSPSFEKTQADPALEEKSPENDAVEVAVPVELDGVVGSTVDTDGSPSDRNPSRTLTDTMENMAVNRNIVIDNENDAIEKSTLQAHNVTSPVADIDDSVITASAPAAGTVATLQSNPVNSSALEMLRGQLDDYIAHMGKAVPVTKEVGGAWQRRFFQLLERIMKLEGSVFNRAWSDLLARVLSERKGAFHESRAFRFMETSKLDNDQIRIFSNLIHLVINTADPQGRQQMLKMIDISSVTKDLPIEGASDKIQAYYLA